MISSIFGIGALAACLDIGCFRAEIQDRRTGDCWPLRSRVGWARPREPYAAGQPDFLAIVSSRGWAPRQAGIRSSSVNVFCAVLFSEVEAAVFCVAANLPPSPARSVRYS